MKKFYFLLLSFFLTVNLTAQDTFSIIAVDPATGEVGSAGASCVTGIGGQGIINIITDIIPGKGGINSQAYVCIPNINLMNGIDQMEAGLSPSEIIDWLYNNDACGSQGFNPEFRQYGVVDFDSNGDPRTAGFSGNMTDDYKEDRQGATYTIQGNILLNQTVIDNMEDNFNNTTGTLADKLMAAMQGANFPGADSRCLNDGTSSTTAYLLVYKADDNPNDPYLSLNIGEQNAGVEPIDLLQDAYDNFLSVESNSLKGKIKIFPNPVVDEINIRNEESVNMEYLNIYDIQGKEVLAQKIPSGNVVHQKFETPFLQPGIYFLKITSDQGTATFKFVKE